MRSPLLRCSGKFLSDAAYELGYIEFVFLFANSDSVIYSSNSAGASLAKAVDRQFSKGLATSVPRDNQEHLSVPILTQDLQICLL